MSESGSDISEAVVIFIGFGRSPFPVEDRAALSKRFGLSEAAELERLVISIVKEMHRINIDWSIYSLDTAAAKVRSEMRLKYPNLSDNAILALVWKFTYESK